MYKMIPLHTFEFEDLYFDLIKKKKCTNTNNINLVHILKRHFQVICCNIVLIAVLI